MNPSPTDYCRQALAALNAADAVSAAAHCRSALAQDPGSFDARILLGMALYTQGAFAEAADAFGVAVRLRPADVDAWNNLGAALKELGRWSAARDALLRAVALNPRHAGALSNLGAVWQFGFQDVPRAVLCYERAIAIDPGNVNVRWNLCRARLLGGDWPRGWDDFDVRLDVPHLRLRREFRQPQWRGEAPAGKTLLLHAEGGFGDTLQYIRYAPIVEKLGARVLLECQPTLVSLLKSTPGLSGIFARGQQLPSFDWHVPLPSLPAIFRTTLASASTGVPYVTPSTEKVASWAKSLAGDRSLKVGIAWAGSTSTPEYRTRTLSTFAPLADAANVTFYSLQQGIEASEPTPPGMKLIRVLESNADFSETAALVCNLDLVITVDTSIAHLAGALARPTWVLIPSYTDFRWLLHRQDSPWYPTLRLFRQQVTGDWSEPVRQVASNLAKRINQQ